MKVKVTKSGVLIPKKMLEGYDEVEIQKEENFILIFPITKSDPLLHLGSTPLQEDNIPDASENHDCYLYLR